MQSCLRPAADAIRPAEVPVSGTPAGTVVVRAADLLVRGGGTVTAGGRAPSAGEMAVFCRPVVTAPAVVRRDGTVLADAWLPDLVRLGELERHLGDGVIEAIVGEAVAAGRLRPRQRRRLMSYPLVIRLMLAMVLMPDGSYCESLARLAGLLADIPFALEWHVPTEKVVTDWRALVPADVMEDLFWQAAGPLIGDGEPSAVLLAGMMVLAADGMLVNLGTRRRTGPCSARPGPPVIPPRSRSCGSSRWPPRRPGHARRDPGQQPCRGADPAETARETPPGAVRWPRDLLRQEFPRP